MKYLMVVSHPDDEVLGAGASIYKWTRPSAETGEPRNEVDVCIMCMEAKARAFRPADKELDDDLSTSTKYLGIGRKYVATFPNIEMNTVPHIELVQHIELAIQESQPDIVITHHQLIRIMIIADIAGLPRGCSSVPTQTGGETLRGVLVYGGTIVYGVGIEYGIESFSTKHVRGSWQRGSGCQSESTKYV